MALALILGFSLAACAAAATPSPPPPPPSAEPSVAAALPPGAYVVKPGDTVITVVDSLRISQEDLVAWNTANQPNIGSNPELHAGDLLWTAGPPAGTQPAAKDPKTAKVAESWIDGAWYVYHVALPPNTQALGTLQCCVAGASQNEAVGSTGEGTTPRPDPAVALIKAHLAWLAANPAPTCMADGYAADAELASAYLWWLGGWQPLGGAKTIAGSAYLAGLKVIDAHRDTFLKTRYLADCA
jgi:hypothetical protein